jgi:flagellar assembly protein FliH
MKSAYAQPSNITAYDAPALPPLAALRDRADEAAECRALMREDGFAAGYQAGLDAAAHHIASELADHRSAAERLQAAAMAFEAAARDLSRQDAVALADVEREAIELAVALAEELVGYELTSVDEPVRDALTRAAALLPDRGTPVIRVHPADEATTVDATASSVLTWGGEVSIVADPSVERGGCVVDVGPCRIDAQLASAIGRMRATLTPG